MTTIPKGCDSGATLAFPKTRTVPRLSPDPVRRLVDTHGAGALKYVVGGSEVRRICVDGPTRTQADRIAILFGHHPAELWGDEWWAA